MATLAAAAVLLSACGDSTEGLFGGELFERSCAVCHRSDGSGSGNRPAIGVGSNAVGLSDEQIAGVIRAGPGVMPSFQRLTAGQVDSLVAYVRLLQGEGG